MTTRFSKHLGKGTEIELDGETFMLRPLTTKNLPDFFKAMKAFGGVEGKDAKDMFAALTDESMSAIQHLIEDTLEKSFPTEWGSDCEEVKAWGMKNMMELLPKIFEINTPEDKGSESQKKEKIMSRLKDAKDTGQASATE